MTLLDVHVGRPVHRGALTLFPLWNGRAVARPGYVLAAGRVSVAERDGAPVVGELVVTNPADRPALVLDGDLLEGGHQHRVADRAVLVPAQRSHVLEVSCVEAGRWSGGHQHHAGRRRAPLEVRAAVPSGQHEVWRRVDGYAARYGRNDTSSLLHAADRARSAAVALVSGLEPLPGQCGVLVGLAGQPLLLELVDAPRTFAALWRPLLESVALDALGARPIPTPGRRARRFVERVGETALTLTGDAGLGQALRGRSSSVDLRGLVWQERLVTAAVVNPRHELVAA